jgi:hypothetical protein
MTSSFKFHSSVPEIIPWQAQYNFPSQSNKVRKQTVKLVPKNGYSFTQNQIVRFEFPADGYCNMLNTALSFDVKTTLNPFTMAADDGTHHNAILPTPVVSLPRGGAHNYFKRVRVLYGSLVLEDIQEYKTLNRMFTEMGIEKSYQQGSGSIIDGQSESAMRNINNPFVVSGTIGNGVSATVSDATFGANPIADNNTLQSQQIGGTVGFYSTTNSSFSAALPASTNAANTIQPVFSDIGQDNSDSSQSVLRTFEIQLLTGLTTLKKLLPLKWMASQLVIELTIAPVTEAYISNLVVPPTITLQNMNMITELLEFDSSYDLAFFEGLNQPTGVPLKFTSWHYHQFAVTGQTQTYQIHERSRSVKSAFAVLRQTTPILPFDADWFFHNMNDSLNPISSVTPASGTAVAIGMYVSPQSATNSGGILTVTNGTGALGNGFIRASSVALSSLNSTTTATNLASLNACAPIQQYQWRIGGQYYPAQPVRVTSTLGVNLNNAIARGEEAYIELLKAVNSLGDPTVSGGIHHWNYTITGTNGVNGEGSKFIMGTSFETPGLGPESINGINAEEQSDLALTLYSNQGGSAVTTITQAKKLEVFVNYDCLLLVRSGNVVDLVL